MRTRVLAPLSAMTLAIVVVWAPVLVAQAQSRTASTMAATVWDPTTSAPSGWTPPRTPWGDPDLQGYWYDRTYTPLERPRGLAGKPLYTVEEAIEVFKKAIASDAEVDPTTIHYDPKEYGLDTWQNPIRPSRRTSLIVDPPDGRIPPLTPEAQKRQTAQAAASERMGTYVQTRSLYERCVTGNAGPPRIGGTNAESQIVQAPGYVVLIINSNNEVRIIPLDGRPHLSQNVGQSGHRSSGVAIGESVG